MAASVIDATWREVDEFVEPFELSWRADGIPDVTAFLPPVEHPQFRETLLELLRVDLELRWRHGCVKSIDDYRREFSDWLDDAESLSQIAFEEFRARRQAGESVTADEYCQQYGFDTSAWPDFAESNLDNATAGGSPTNGFGSLLRDMDHSLARRAGVDAKSLFPDVGSTLLNFHLQSELGRGAFSRVYLARQGDLANRLVVLKVSSESFAEADKLAQLQHANIVPIYSVHQAESWSVVVMPYFGAATLADVAREVHGGHSLPPSGRVIVETLNACGERTAVTRHKHDAPTRDAMLADSELLLARRAGLGELTTRVHYDGALKTLSGLTFVEAVLWIGAKLADGLSHAHERGILHRDLKPANVLLADDGRSMLLDFYLSADVKQTASVRDMLVGGTLPYMAPEQIYAFQQRIHGGDVRSDLYSLGVILFELLAGRLPFPTHRGALEPMLSRMLQDRQHALPKLRAINPSVTPAVEAIIRRCLEPDPSQRYQTAAELHEDIERHLKQLPLRHTSEPSLRERTQKWTRRHSRLTAILCFVMIVGGISLAIGAHRENKRVKAVESEVASLMSAGQNALDDDDFEVAHGRFLAAWMKVQAEPALADHQTGVAGWLDHSRQMVVHRRWRKRSHTREFDDRRDEALVLSLLMNPSREDAPKFTPPSATIAHEAVQAAVALTIPNDPGWTRERELLVLLDANLISLEGGSQRALQRLDETNEFESRLFHERRAVLLDQLGRDADAEFARQRAVQFPPNPLIDDLVRGVEFAQRSEFESALRCFEQILEQHPDTFHARLFQAIAFLNLQRPAEAKVALTACIAQRPQFLWSYVFRSQAHSALGEDRAAQDDLQTVLEMNPQPFLQQTARSLLAASP